MAECSSPPQPARKDALGTFYPSLEPGFLHPAFCTPTPTLAFTPLILCKSRMRRRARTDLCGGRSAMVVPTATVNRPVGTIHRTSAIHMAIHNNVAHDVLPMTCGAVRALPCR